MKKSVVLLIAMFCIIVIGIFTINAQSPTPSPTGSPTQSVSPLPTSSLPPCSGEASLTITTMQKKDFTEEDSKEKIKENLKKEFNDIMNSQTVKDFKECKEPPTFSCPSHCEVILKEVRIEPIVIIPQSTLESYGNKAVKRCQKTGTIKIFFGLADIMSIVFINTLSSVISQELTKIANDAAKDCPCPSGTQRIITITIDGPVKSETGWFGLFPPKYGTMYTAKYIITVSCLKESSNENSYSWLVMSGEFVKECREKK